MYSSMAPFSKTTLDINKLYVSSNYPNKIPDEGEAASEKQEESLPSKQSKLLWVCRWVGVWPRQLAGKGLVLVGALQGVQGHVRGIGHTVLGALWQPRPELGQAAWLCAGEGWMQGASSPTSRHTAAPRALGRPVAVVVVLLVTRWLVWCGFQEAQQWDTAGRELELSE